MTPEDRARLAHDETEPDDVIDIPLWIPVGITCATIFAVAVIVVVIASWTGLIA